MWYGILVRPAFGAFLVKSLGDVFSTRLWLSGFVSGWAVVFALPLWHADVINVFYFSYLQAGFWIGSEFFAQTKLLECIDAIWLQRCDWSVPNGGTTSNVRDSLHIYLMLSISVGHRCTQAFFWNLGWGYACRPYVLLLAQEMRGYSFPLA